MKKKIVRLTESDLHRIVKESVNILMNEGEDYGWVVNSYEAQDAYDLAVEQMGEETVNREIVRCLGSDTLADCLAHMFRMYDFRQWNIVIKRIYILITLPTIFLSCRTPVLVLSCAYATIS